jgi:hypothetical protein
MVLSKHIKVIGLGIVLSLTFFLSQAKAQDNCKLHKREVKEVTKLFGESTEIVSALTENDSHSAVEYLHPGDCLYRIVENEKHRGYLLSTSAKGRYDYFDYSVIFSQEKAILRVIVTVYRSTQGAAICQKNWLSQFEGYKGGAMELGSDIDAVSGGTISATSMVKDILRCHLLISSLETE